MRTGVCQGRASVYQPEASVGLCHGSLARSGEESESGVCHVGDAEHQKMVLTTDGGGVSGMSEMHRNALRFGSQIAFGRMINRFVSIFSLNRNSSPDFSAACSALPR